MGTYEFLSGFFCFKSYFIPSNGAECELPNGWMSFEIQIRYHPAFCIS